MRPCPNCKKHPEYRPSDEKGWPVLLVHDQPTCPKAPFGRIIYHHTEQEAEAIWESHVQALLVKPR